MVPGLASWLCRIVQDFFAALASHGIFVIQIFLWHPPLHTYTTSLLRTSHPQPSSLPLPSTCTVFFGKEPLNSVKSARLHDAHSSDERRWATIIQVLPIRSELCPRTPSRWPHSIRVSTKHATVMDRQSTHCRTVNTTFVLPSTSSVLKFSVRL
jgi:hypothetical protein